MFEPEINFKGKKLKEFGWLVVESGIEICFYLNRS